MSPRIARAVGVTCPASAAACTSASILAGDSIPLAARVVLVVAAFTSFGVLFLPAVRAVALTKGRVVVVSALLLLVAVAVPPSGRDMWSYVMYGRIVSDHHASPYVHVPADYPNDSLLSMVGWRHTPSVYGPAFTAVSAVATAAAGDSSLMNRVLFQGIEAAALAAAMVLIWRRTRDPVAVAFVGLNPALLFTVTDGHNDVLVGLAILAGVLLVSDGRGYAAGVVLAAGVLVKLVVVLALVVLVVWAWRNRSHRVAAATAGTAALVSVLAYALAGGRAALTPVLDAAGARNSRTSFWSALHVAPGSSGVIAFAVLAAVTLYLVARSAHAPAAWVVSAVILGFLVVAPYVLPWYVAWGLPVVALVWRSTLAVIVAVQAGLLELAYAGNRAASGFFHSYYSGVVPVCYLLALVVVVVLAGREGVGSRITGGRGD